MALRLWKVSLIFLLAIFCNASAFAEPAKKIATIRFLAPVTAETTNALLNAVDAESRKGVEEVHLLISSPGGDVLYGLSAYNYLVALPVKIVTHNFGGVDSIAIALYCAGVTRYSVPNGQFLLHGVATTFPQVPIEQNQTVAMAKVISHCTGQQLAKVINTIKEKTVLSAEEAKKWGLVQKIEAELIPLGAETISIVAREQPPKSPGTQQIGLMQSSPYDSFGNTPSLGGLSLRGGADLNRPHYNENITPTLDSHVQTLWLEDGGWGPRSPKTRKGLPDFESGALANSANPPYIVRLHGPAGN